MNILLRFLLGVSIGHWVAGVPLDMAHKHQVASSVGDADDCEKEENLDSSITLPHPLYCAVLAMLKTAKKGGGSAVELKDWPAKVPLFRVQDAMWPTVAMITNGLGAKNAGGRWNSKGVPALYMALESITALIECEVASSREDPPVIQTYPRIIVGMKLIDGKVLDMSLNRFDTFKEAVIEEAKKMGETCKYHEPSENAWQKLQEKNDESFTQAVGRACYNTGIAGIIVNSNAHVEEVPYRNVVLFPKEGEEVPFSIKLIDEKVIEFMTQSMGALTDAQIKSMQSTAGDKEKVYGGFSPYFNGGEARESDYAAGPTLEETLHQLEALFEEKGESVSEEGGGDTNFFEKYCVGQSEGASTSSRSSASLASIQDLFEDNGQFDDCKADMKSQVELACAAIEQKMLDSGDDVEAPSEAERAPEEARASTGGDKVSESEGDGRPRARPVVTSAASTLGFCALAVTD